MEGFCHIVCEPRGGYERALLQAALQRGVAVSCVNALRIRRFAQAQGRLAKTDSIDAIVIADFGRLLEPNPMVPPSTKQEALCAMQPFKRSATHELHECLSHFPAVVLTGPRQCGKTTLAQEIAKSLDKPTLYLDLESATDRRKLTDPNAFLDALSDHLVILDEVQRVPGLFPQLRGIIDRRRTSSRFLLLGSASPLLLRQSGESLAGRIAHVELTPFRIPEVGVERLSQLWLRGGFPDSLLAPSI